MPKATLAEAIDDPDGGVPSMANTAAAQKKYDTGASDTEIKIGNIVPYSGPASAYGVDRESERRRFQESE